MWQPDLVLCTRTTFGKVGPNLAAISYPVGPNVAARIGPRQNLAAGFGPQD